MDSLVMDAEEIAVLRRTHQLWPENESKDREHCSGCTRTMPCPTTRLLVTLETAERDLAEARAALAQCEQDRDDAERGRGRRVDQVVKLETALATERATTARLREALKEIEPRMGWHAGWDSWEVETIQVAIAATEPADES